MVDGTIRRNESLAKKILKNATIFICQLFVCILPYAVYSLTQDQQDEAMKGRTAPSEDINDEGEGCPIGEEILKCDVNNELQEEMDRKRKAEQEEQKKRNKRRKKLEKEIKEKETKVEELKNEKESLKKFYISKFHANELKTMQKTRDITGAEDIYSLIIPQLLNDVEEELKTLLTAPVVEREGCIAIITSGEKDQYGAYGLLLSAYKLLHPSLPDDKCDKNILEKACSKVDVQLEGRMKKKVAENVKATIKLTREMLFLIPPLIVGSEEMVLGYDEDICDTNRKTWDEKRKRDKLLWYRPVLTYGNQLHIAVKGLVGNCTEPIPDEEKEVEAVPVPIAEGVITKLPLYPDPEAVSDNQGAATGDNALMMHQDPETPDTCNSEIQKERSPFNKLANQGTDLEEESKADSEDGKETYIN